ncbi:hypothetical protein OG357_32130 [Streptomyces sp. NBC_01255]|nr:hypothetical protein [Streptomyces sp. NBC_01255]
MSSSAHVDATDHLARALEGADAGAWVLRVLRLVRGRDRTRTPGT